MNLQKKIFCGILALSSVFGGLVGSLNAKAMIGDESGVSLKKDAEIDKPDAYGRTPLMKAVMGLNVERVKELLDKGASLSIPEGRRSTENQVYSNVFELLCDKDLSHDEQSHDDGSLYYDPYFDYDHTATNGPKVEAIAKMILEHCVKCGINLHVNTLIFRPQFHKYSVSAWQWCGKKLFEANQESYPHLFTTHADPVSYFIGDTMYRLA